MKYAPTSNMSYELKKAIHYTPILRTPIFDTFFLQPSIPSPSLNPYLYPLPPKIKK